MKKAKRILSLFLAMLMLLTTVGMIVSCGDDPIDTDTGSGNTPNPDEKVQYTVEIVTTGGRPMEGLYPCVYDKDGSLVDMQVTNANGIATFSLKQSSDYTVGFGQLFPLPQGYACAEKTPLTQSGTKILVSSGVIADSDLTGVTYKIGDVIRDFTVVDSDGNTIKLSDLLDPAKGGKKAVILNFWYVGCSWCVEEFPYMNSAYENYKDEIEIIALNNYMTDTVDDIKDFKESMQLSFPMAKDVGVEDTFGFDVNPFTVVIDRYGVICGIEVGALIGERYFTNLFEHFTKDDYKQTLLESLKQLSPTEKPDIEMPDSSVLEEAAVSEGVNVTFRPETNKDAEYSWPFITDTVDGRTVIRPSNKDKDGSFSILYADIELKEGEAIMFDYLAYTQASYDILYVLINGKDIYSISGAPDEDDENPWRKCCPYVALEDGTYELSFVYIKDAADSVGDDTVYIDDIRIVDESEVDVETYIPHNAATKPNASMTEYGSYVEVYLGEDGYYHVGSETGPLLLAGLIVSTPFSSDYTVTDKMIYDGKFMVDGVDVAERFVNTHCNYASNSKIYGYCTVNEELRTYLEAFVKKYGFGTNENTWLQLCSYYESYGTETEFEDPTRGLAPDRAYGAAIGTNTVEYVRYIMPRGYLYEFIPETSGVYRIVTNSTQEVDGWIFVGSYDDWAEKGNGKKIIYTTSDSGERYYEGLLIDPDDDGISEIDRTNCSMVAYFEAGESYYINIAYYDVYGLGKFTFDLSFIGEHFDFFHEASPGVYTFLEGENYDPTTGEGIGEVIAGGIDVALCEDENDPRYGYYCHKLEDGSLGSILYADFFFTTNIFTRQNIQQLIETDAFNFGMTALDHDARAYLSNYTNGDDLSKLQKYWGDDFDENWAYYRMDDVRDGIYHGKGPDLTEEISAYVAKMLNEKDTDGNSIYPERQGCVMVDKRLAELLQMLMDKFSFSGVDHSWTKLCYYYEYLGYEGPYAE